MDELSSQPGFLNSHMPSEKVEVGKFKLPRFKISFGFEASKAFVKLGVGKSFLPGGLTKMVDLPMGDELFVSGIFQESFIEVNEDGTETAFASLGIVEFLCATEDFPHDFVADHPFIIVLREDKSGGVLAIGHVLNPSL